MFAGSSAGCRPDRKRNDARSRQSRKEPQHGCSAIVRRHPSASWRPPRRLPREPAWRGGRPQGRRLRHGPSGLECHGRPATGADCPLRRDGRCRRRRAFCPRPGVTPLRQGRRSLGGRQGRLRRWPDDRPRPHAGPSTSTGSGERRAPREAPRGAPSTARPKPSGWRPPVASSPPPASPASPLAVASAS